MTTRTILDTPHLAIVHVGDAPVEPKQRTISAIALEISRLWRKPYFGAVPYLAAMRGMDNASDPVGHDSGKSIILYFLSNASSWRGDDARRLKAELKKAAGIK